MEIVELKRTYLEKVTLGKLISPLLPVEICTIELPYRDNKPYISCIPEGEYKVKKTYSSKSKKKRWEITGVENRTGIRFDVANYIKQLLGCVAVGLNFDDIDNDGIIDLQNSKAALKLMSERLPDEFILKISKKKS